MTTELKPTFAELMDDARGCNGCDDYYRHWLGLIYTSGVRELAERAGAYWLIDLIASHQPGVRRAAMRDGRLRDFQIWTLEVWTKPRREKMARAACCADINDDGTPDNECRVQLIPCTDFPPTIDSDGRPTKLKLYLERGEHWVLMLPSER